jgi:hypothetical protein
MSHKCTRCEHIFKDGDIEILNGCPNCGWNKFLYVHNEPEQEDELKSQEEQPEKKALKEIDEFLTDQGDEVEEIAETEEELDQDRIESLRINEPGSYELNLEALLERKEIIMAMKEDGKYVVHLPSVFDTEKDKKKKK